MKPEATINQHKMTLYNHDLVAEWHFENDFIKISEVRILYNSESNLLKFISGKIFEAIMDERDPPVESRNEVERGTRGPI